MAAILKFVRGAYASMGSLTVDLLAGDSAGLQLLDDWQPKIATPTMWPPQAVTETLRVLAHADDTDGLATVLQGLHRMQRFAVQYWADRDEYTPVWLHAQLANESEERRCLVRKIEANFDFGWFSAEAVANQLEMTLVVEREPYWESVTPAAAIDSGGDISLLGGSMELSAATGDAPARLASLTMTPLTVAAGTYTQLWLGFRSAERHDPVGEFVSLWELEDATALTDTTAMSSIYQSGGNGQQCDFATAAGWAARLSWSLADMAPPASYATAAQRGTFLVLLRANSAADTEIDVQLRAGHADHVTHYSDIVRVQLDTNGLFCLGLMTLPLRDMHAFGDVAASLEAYQFFQLWARRVSGSADLDLDCILLIPADELLVYVDNAVMRDNGGIPNQVLLSSAPEGHLAALSQEYNETDGLWYAIAAGDVSADGRGIGLGAGRLYVAAALADNTNKVADIVDVQIQRYHRYLSLRGATP